MDITRIIGCRYFVADNDEQGNVVLNKLYKVIGIQNEKVLKVHDLLNDTIIKIDKQTLEEECVLLEPDAYVLFTIVNLQNNIEDVIVSMFRVKDMAQANTVPYCVCRQNITNLYGAMIRTQDLSSPFPLEVGMCMSIETIPDGVDYNIMTACDGIKHMTMVAAYLDDKLDDMLSCVKVKKYDAVLETLFQDHIKHVLIDRDIASKQPIHMGYCRTLKSLLEYTSFMYDFRRAFGVAEVDVDLSKGVTEDGRLLPEAKEIIQKSYNKYILNELVIKFDKDIDLDSIQQTKIMICDKNENIYIITYTEGKNYIEDTIHSNSKMSPAEKLEAVFKSAGVVDSSK